MRLTVIHIFAILFDIVNEEKTKLNCYPLKLWRPSNWFIFHPIHNLAPNSTMLAMDNRNS